MGELAGLPLERVDLLRHKIRVDQQLVEDAGKLSFGPPKTKAGDRTVTMRSGLTDVLAAHFASKACQQSEMAFPTITGQLMRRSNFRRLWRRKVDGSDKRPGVFSGTDLEGLVFHGLRHTRRGARDRPRSPSADLKERLGHSSITVTMDTYGHLFPSADEALAEALDAAFRDAHPASARPETPRMAQSAGETPERPDLLR